MANADFIKVDFYLRNMISNKIEDHKLKEKSTFIRLDAFMQIDDLEQIKTYENEYSNKLIRTLKVSRCYLNRMMGLGINGISTDIYLTEKSYKKLIKVLDLKN